VKVFYSSEYVGAGYAFETTRKAKWIADSLETSPVAGMDLVEPEPLSREQVEETHGPQYVEAVRTGVPRYLAESQGFTWDPGLWPMVLASNGGVVAAAFEALGGGFSGSLSSGLHHARRGHGAGFCTFNGLVIAARAAVAGGAESVLILDLDAHCGGGTASLIAEDGAIWQTDVSVCAFDAYEVGVPPNGTQRIRLCIVGDSAGYLAEVERSLEETARTWPQFDLCLYNAGMDPYEGCSTGGLGGITSDILAARERLAFAWCREHAAATAFVLAGGYVGWGLDEEGLVDLHRLTLSAAAESTGASLGESGAE
jgi:acetoin utilization deacetylase AcuC-like enzyme